MKNLFVFALFLYTIVGFSQAKIEFKAKNNTIDYGSVTKEGDSGIRKFEFN